ncbi:MAG TPA: hypothetical protein VLM38_20555 [Blastocatellia bacterium]|nr:hypothetical protein [Blastocatellia bacterium]
MASEEQSTELRLSVSQALHTRIYERSDRAKSLRQGEILTDIVQVKLQLDSLTEETAFIDSVNHPYAIIVSQDCDLIQDFGARNNAGVSSDKLLPSVLFCEVVTAEELRGREGIKSDIWKRIRANKDERYQFLEKVQPQDDACDVGLPELGIDFKRYFSLPTEEVYYRLDLDTKRRCRLVTPYAEHVSSRFCYYLVRIALPRDHYSEA